MKFETKLSKILNLENDKLKKLKLISLSFSCVSGSNQQKKVKTILNSL
jgi:hypothetical protein